LIDEFKSYLIEQGKSENTIKSYLLHLSDYIKWFQQSYGSEFKSLYRENVLDYKSYLINVKKYKGKNLNGKTVNAKLSAIIKFNKFLLKDGVQSEIVITEEDFIKIQLSYANPTDVNKAQVENFRQRILESGDKRLYGIVTIMGYGGLRISEALNIKLDDYNFITKELIVKNGKGEKQRVVYINSKIINAIKEYLKIRNSGSEFLFVSRQRERLDRTRINKQFKQYSKEITPHMLRHFYCTNAIESKVYSIHELANQAGHSNIQTTLLYTNPSREEMRRKAELL
jgi:integrase/recombinase XerD